MTSMTLPVPGSTEARSASLRRASRAEWTKLRTVRSTWSNVTMAAGTSIALSVLLAFAAASEWDKLDAGDRADFDPTSAGLVGVLVSALVMGSIAIRSTAGEYASGMIRSTFAAVPSRRRVLAAKALVIAALSFPVALVANLASYLAAQRVFASKGIGSSLGDPGVIGAIVGSAAAVTLVAVAAIGLGAAIRHAAGANTALSLVMIGSQLIGIALSPDVAKFLPGYVLQAMVSTRSTDDLLPQSSALAMMIVYAALIYEVGKQRISRGDG